MNKKIISTLALAGAVLTFSGCGKNAADRVDVNAVGTLICAKEEPNNGWVTYLIDTDGNLETAEYAASVNYKDSSRAIGVVFNAKPGTKRTIGEWKRVSNYFDAVPVTGLEKVAEQRNPAVEKAVTDGKSRIQGE